MRKIYLTVVCLLTLSMVLIGQESESKSFKNKLYTGGHLGLTFGSYTNIIISPLLGARLTDRIYAGLGVEYQYTRDKTISPSLTYNQYGGRLFAQYNVLPQLFAHTELAGMSMQRYNTLLIKERNFVPFLYVGGGYRQKLSERSFLSFRVLFDVWQDKNSPYKALETVYSVGFGIGI